MAVAAVIAKVDTKDAFRLVPIRTEDCTLLVFTWAGMFYHDKVLQMGSAVSCQTFERLNRKRQWILQTYFQFNKVTHLLDDFIYMGTAKSAKLSKFVAFL